VNASVFVDGLPWYVDVPIGMWIVASLTLLFEGLARHFKERSHDNQQ
jgi:hypothetical protein